MSQHRPRVPSGDVGDGPTTCGRLLLPKLPRRPTLRSASDEMAHGREARKRILHYTGKIGAVRGVEGSESLKVPGTPSQELAAAPEQQGGGILPSQSQERQISRVRVTGTSWVTKLVQIKPRPGPAAELLLGLSQQLFPLLPGDSTASHGPGPPGLSHAVPGSPSWPRHIQHPLSYSRHRQQQLVMAFTSKQPRPAQHPLPQSEDHPATKTHQATGLSIQ